jgi:two-component sensor histidine kinase
VAYPHRETGNEPELLHPRLDGTEFAQHLQTVVTLFATTTQQAATRADQAAQATLRASMGRVQSLAAELEAAISLMQDRHDNPDVLEGLLRLDHLNSQIYRRAQAIAVLCGSWPGQQRSASSLTDVVRGATGRIRDFPRVQPHMRDDIFVGPRWVEAVVLALAELLDNAARHSSPDTPVDVTFLQAHHGMVIQIDDAGVGMSSEALDKAAHLLSGREDVNIHRLGEPPQVGFAVIGKLAGQYGFTASIKPNHYGGVRAEVFLPTELLTTSTKPEPVLSAPTGAANPDRARAAAPTPGTEQQHRTSGGLPMRQRHRRQPTVPPPPPAAPQPAPPTSAPTIRAEQSAAGINAWQASTQANRRQTGTFDRERNL